MNPFVAAYLVAAGPYVPLVVLFVFVMLVWLAMWMLEPPPAPLWRRPDGTYMRLPDGSYKLGPRPRRSRWRVGLACVILAYLAVNVLSLLPAFNHP